jgi:hypothetical protein
MPPDQRARGDALWDLDTQSGRLVDRSVREAGQAPDVLGELDALVVVVPAPAQGPLPSSGAADARDPRAGRAPTPSRAEAILGY